MIVFEKEVAFSYAIILQFCSSSKISGLTLVYYSKYFLSKELNAYLLRNRVLSPTLHLALPKNPLYSNRTIKGTLKIP